MAEQASTSAEAQPELLRQFTEQLAEIDRKLPATPATEVSALFRDVPLEVFGWLSLQRPHPYHNIARFFPRMASDELQCRWTGTSGEALLALSAKFVGDVAAFCARRDIAFNAHTRLLDFGCGWGRMIRLFYKYLASGNIYAVDAWQVSLDLARECGVRANFAKIDDVCRALPFDVSFDVAIAFSVFTHLSEKSAFAAQNAVRERIAPHGVFVITLRPPSFWDAAYAADAARAEALKLEHVARGFAYVPHDWYVPVDGEVTYGDASISIDYIARNWPRWRVLDMWTNEVDPMQTLVFLGPADAA